MLQIFELLGYNVVTIELKAGIIKMTSISKVANFLKDHANSLAVEIVESVLTRMGITIPDWEKEQAILMYIELLGFIGKSLIENNEGVPDDLIVWSQKNAKQQVSSGGKISEIVVRYPPTREVFTERLTEISTEYGLSLKENAFVINRINAMLDQSLNETIFAFEQLTQEYREKTQKEIAKLSAPVVLIKTGVAVLPLIGEVNSYRASYILEKVVPEISDMKLDHLIIDCSGILMIDSETARYLRQLEDILLLLGINVLVTGLRPELALAVVQSGMDMTRISTFAHVKQALESIE